MRKPRPTYTEEFRRDAVELLRTSGRPADHWHDLRPFDNAEVEIPEGAEGLAIEMETLERPSYAFLNPERIILVPVEQ